MGPGIDRRVFSLPGPHSPTSVRGIGVRETCVGAYSEITNKQQTLLIMMVQPPSKVGSDAKAEATAFVRFGPPRNPW